MNPETTANQKLFNDLHGEAVERSQELEDWLGNLLNLTGKVRHYATTAPNPSQQLKNKLSQAASAGDGVVVFLTLDDQAYERGVNSLVRGWKKNHWPTAVAAVGFIRKNAGWRVADIVLSRPSNVAATLNERVFGDVNVIWAEGFEPEAERSIESLAEKLFVPRWWIQDVLALAEKERAVIFFGPPGTGKTFIARELARFIQPDERLRRIVQLHPSYGYEQFFEGYRPVAGSGLTLQKRPGALKRLISSMIADEAAVLVLDEINRANLPRVFGELYYLLEYRDEEVELMYAEDDPPETFRLPSDLIFLGTMNTADRSVAVIDQALRRRFAFVDLFPDRPPIASDGRGHNGVLREFLLATHQPGWIADVVDRANQILGDPERGIGPSFFLRRDLTDSTIEQIWSRQVLPSVADVLSSRGQPVAALALSTLRGDWQP